MTTPASTISTSDVNTENGYAASQQISFDDTAVRLLAGGSGPTTQISMATLQNRTGGRNLYYTAPKQNANLINDFSLLIIIGFV